MKITVLADNGVAATAVAYHLLLKNPEIDPRKLATASCPLGFSATSPSRFEFPRDLGLSSLPRTEPVKTKPFGFDSKIRNRTRRHAYLGVNSITVEPPGSGKTSFATDFGPSMTDAELVDHIRSSDEVYLVYAQGPHGAHLARTLRNWVSDADANPEYIFAPYGDPLMHENFRIALDNATTEADLETESVPSLIKQYFEYNYLLNSIPIMSATSNAALGRDVGNALSRDFLQILFHLREHSGIDLPFFVKSITSWKGTGRYEGTVSFGWGDGPNPEDPTVSHLKEQGLADITPDNKVVITDDGRKLLDAIHADCCDIDQKHRLKEWMKLGEATARVKIDQYVNTFFGKQLRHLDI